MKYTAKFEEMVDFRNQAIENCKKVVAEQDALVSYLSKEPEAKERFKQVIDSLNNEIKENQKKIIFLGEANANTLYLIEKLKKLDNDTSAFIEKIIKELGVFENMPNIPKEEKPQPKDESKKDK